VAARHAADVARNEATEHFQLARGAVDRLMTRVAEEELLNAPQMERLRESLLSDALGFYEQMLNRNDSSPELQHEVALAQMRMGGILYRLNRREDAARADADAARRLRKLVASHPDVAEYKHSLAKTLYESSYHLHGLSEGSGDETHSRLANENCREAIGILDVLNRDFPNTPEFVVSTASALEYWSRHASQSERIDRLKQAQSILEPLAHSSNATNEQKSVYADILNQLGLSLRDDQGKKFTEEAKQILRELLKSDATDEGRRWRLAQLIWESAIIYPPADITEHVAAQEESVALMAGIVRDFPLKSVRRSDLAQARIQLGHLYKQAGNVDAARDQFAAAKKLGEELWREFPQDRDFFMRLLAAQFRLVDFYDSQKLEDAWLREMQEIKTNLLEQREGEYDHFRAYLASFVELQTANALVLRGRRAEGIELGREGFRRAWAYLDSVDDKAKAHAIGMNFGAAFDFNDLLGEIAVRLHDAGDTQHANEFVENLSRISQLYLEQSLHQHMQETNVPTYGACFLTAWPDPQLRNREVARQLIDQALVLPNVPGSGMAPEFAKLRVLALVEFRFAEWQKSIDAMKKSIRSAESAGLPLSEIDCLVLTMAYLQLGNEEESKTWSSKARALKDSPGSTRVDTDSNEPQSKRDAWWVFFERHFRTEVEPLIQAAINKDSQQQATWDRRSRPVRDRLQFHLTAFRQFHWFRGTKNAILVNRVNYHRLSCRGEQDRLQTVMLFVGILAGRGSFCGGFLRLCCVRLRGRVLGDGRFGRRLLRFIGAWLCGWFLVRGLGIGRLLWLI
jgi:hypothetical protein